MGITLSFITTHRGVSSDGRELHRNSADLEKTNPSFRFYKNHSDFVSNHSDRSVGD